LRSSCLPTTITTALARAQSTPICARYSVCIICAERDQISAAQSTNCNQSEKTNNKQRCMSSKGMTESMRTRILKGKPPSQCYAMPAPGNRVESKSSKEGRLAGSCFQHDIITSWSSWVQPSGARGFSGHGKRTLSLHTIFTCMHP
jgi:hypothetical protein